MAVSVWDWKISLDVRDSNANLNFVSHAHSDHTSAVRKKNKILCSEITKDLVEQKVSYKLDVAQIPKSISMLSSGHMLGSKQLYVEDCVHGCSIVYTGDYLMQRSFASEPIEIKKADVLMIDSTYPYANVIFDDREEVITSIQHYVRYKEMSGCTVFGAYSMGKAQELISIVNDSGIEPVVDSKVARMTEVYNKHGFNLKYQGVENIEDHFDASVMIVNMYDLDKAKMLAIENGKSVFTAVATGFAKMQRFNTDVQFPLSDHADFSQAVEYIERSEADIIYTYGSGSDIMARNLKANGYRAAPFDVKLDIPEHITLKT